MLKKNTIDDFYSKARAIRNLDTAQLKMLSIIKRELKNYYDNGILDTKHSKIYIDYALIRSLSKADEFKKRASTANQLFIKLKKEKLISKKSILYPKNIKYFSINPLSTAFLRTHLKFYDRVTDIRDKLYNKILNNMDDIDLYIFIRLFTLKKIKPMHILDFSKSNYYQVSDGLSLFIVLEDMIGSYTPISSYIIDGKLNNILSSIYSQGPLNNLLENIEHIFTKSLDTYEKALNVYMNHNNINIGQVRACIELEYQLDKSPLELTLKTYSQHPKLSLRELNHLFPNTIDDALIEKEITNEKLYFNNFSAEERVEELSVDINDSINNYISNEIEKFDYFLQIKNISEKTSIEPYLQKWYKFLHVEVLNNNQLLKPIFEYTLIVLMKIDSTKNKKPIKLRTYKDYLGVMFNYCFNIIIAEGKIDETTIRFIENNIQDSLKLTVRTKKRYWRLIKIFIRNHTEFSSNQKIKMVLDIRRSIVFHDEFQTFITDLKNMDLSNYSDQKNKKIKGSIRAVFCILLYYAGLRKTELRTRLLQDIYQVSANTFAIDINRTGFSKTMKSTGEFDLSMKSSSAKRRIRFQVKDELHLKMLVNYLNWLRKQEYKFVFPRISNKGTLLKKHVIKDLFISELSKQLQEVTKRDTPLHTLRHSYATFKLKDELSKNNQNMLFEISNLLGHGEPDVSLSNYMHLDIIKLMINK